MTVLTNKQGIGKVALADGILGEEAADIALVAESGADIALSSDTPLTKSKAIRRLAALQVCSPVHSISPVPLRRRLQNRSASVMDESSNEIQANPNTDVICIDC